MGLDLLVLILLGAVDKDFIPMTLKFIMQRYSLRSVNISDNSLASAQLWAGWNPVRELYAHAARFDIAANKRALNFCILLQCSLEILRFSKIIIWPIELRQQIVEGDCYSFLGMKVGSVSDLHGHRTCTLLELCCALWRLQKLTAGTWP